VTEKLRARLVFVVCQFVYLVALPPVLQEKPSDGFTEIFSLRFMACLTINFQEVWGWREAGSRYFDVDNWSFLTWHCF